MVISLKLYIMINICLKIKSQKEEYPVPEAPAPPKPGIYSSVEVQLIEAVLMRTHHIESILRGLLLRVVARRKHGNFRLPVKLSIDWFSILGCDDRPPVSWVDWISSLTIFVDNPFLSLYALILQCIFNRLFLDKNILNNFFMGMPS